MHLKIFMRAAVSALLFAISTSAYAQGVLDRPRPEYDAKGIPFESFNIFPSIGLDVTGEHNAFQLRNAQQDVFFDQSPSVRVVSDWGRHFLDFYAGADNFDYVKFGQLDLTDWKVGGDGRYDISRDAYISVDGFDGHLHEPLSSPNTVGFQAAPNLYTEGHADLKGHYALNRLSFDLTGTVDRLDYSNTPKIGGGFITNGDRDSTELDGTAKASYNFSPGYSAFLSSTYDTRQYDQFFDRGGFHRSSYGYHFDAGLDLALTSLLQGNVFGGYLNQIFDQKVPLPLKNVSGIDYGASLDWFATPLVTVHLIASHVISETVAFGVSDIFVQTVRLGADYEFRRNIIVSGYAALNVNTFIGATRGDHDPSANITVKYLLNRNMSVNLGYTFNQADSTSTPASFTDNLLTLGLNLHI